MALKKSISIAGMGFVSSLGIVVETGETTASTPPLYIKVESVSGDKSNIKAFVTFTDEEKNQQIIRKDYSFVPNMQGDNFIRQAYQHLKTLPEFENAMDC